MSIKEFRSLIESAQTIMLSEAGGQAPGNMEISRTSVSDAYEHAARVMASYGLDIDEEIPDFKSNYQVAQRLASRGSTKRKDMPVIGKKDVRTFQKRLKNGYIDVAEPFRPSHATDPFPEGLTGSEAKQWLESGLQKYDGESKDDKVETSLTSVAVNKMAPIQEQIYFDKSIETVAENGIDKTRRFITKEAILICSNDNYIIDGHHRFLSAMLVDPTMKAQVLKVDLPITTFLPMATAYGDAIGNKRNL